MSNLNTKSIVVCYFLNAILPGKKYLSLVYIFFLQICSVFKFSEIYPGNLSNLSSLKLLENCNVNLIQGRPDNDLSRHLAEEHGGWFVSSL